ncbi:MAG: small multi-drug export protein [Candidatus Methanoperedenaceae archaeon]|nr:MAG: small multi-drug export protein [Candidatus Methanoperedenaceae archaeon]
MELLVELLTVFGLGAVELWVAIPAGFAMRLPPSVTAITAASGAVLGSFIILNIGEKIRNRLLKRVTGEDKRNKYMHRICDRYGVAGLGLLAPLLIGAPLGTVLGITMGLPAARMFFWMCMGIIVCSIGLTMVTEYGLKSIWYIF